jgi:ketosteroid isomerase-like protein
MSLDQIAEDYVAAVKEGRFLEVIENLYAEDAVSVEAVAMPGSERTTKGLEALRAKSQWFDTQNKINSHEVRGPWPHGEDKFAVHMTFDMTHLESGQRRTTDEIAVLTVADGKITREEFFYAR